MELAIDDSPSLPLWLHFIDAGRRRPRRIAGYPDCFGAAAEPVTIAAGFLRDLRVRCLREEYDTSTRGHRQQAPARALAEGVYRILRHQFGRQTHTHLIYKLEFPTEDKHNEPQEELNIEHEGSFIIQIRNPEQSGHSSGFGGLQSKRRAAFPASLQGCLGKRRFAAADPPDFLNYEGCEFLLISASDDIDRELGLDLKTESEGEEEETAESCSDLIKLFGDSASSKPLFSGTWV